MIDNFAQALRGEEQFLGPGTEGVHNQHILDAAFKSWHSGKRRRSGVSAGYHPCSLFVIPQRSGVAPLVP